MANEMTAFLHDADSRRVVREADEQAAVHRGTLRTAVQACRAQPSSDILLVDLDGEQNPMAHMADLLRICRPETMVLATGTENNVALANDLYRSGVFLYLPKPLDANDIRRAMTEVYAAHTDEARPDIQTSRLVLVVGKGMGTTTVTALLASLAAERGRYVSCLDLDPAFGTLALAFDTVPERGLAQALANPADALAAERLQTRVSARIALVAHPIDQEAERGARFDGLENLIGGLSTHAHLILAVGGTLDNVESLRHIATNHVVVFEPTPAGVSVAARWLRILEGSPSTLVMNHPRPLPQLLSTDHLRNTFAGRLPDIEIPYIKPLARAMALGEPEKAISRREREVLTKLLNTVAGPSVGP